MAEYNICTKVQYSSEADRNKYWIDIDLIKDIKIQASSITEALKKYREIVDEKYYISISDSAIKNKQAMYRDLPDGSFMQTGYIISGKTEVDKGSGYVTKNVQLWLEIRILSLPNELSKDTLKSVNVNKLLAKMKSKYKNLLTQSSKKEYANGYFAAILDVQKEYGIEK